VLAGCGLRQPHSLLDLAYAQHSALKQLDHLNTVGIGQGFHDLDELSHDTSIFCFWNIVVRNQPVKLEYPWRAVSGEASLLKRTGRILSDRQTGKIVFNLRSEIRSGPEPIE
jgi:hypothetical protein